MDDTITIEEEMLLRAKSGAARITQHIGNEEWKQKIPDDFDIMDPVNCILYHVFGSYTMNPLDLQAGESVALGFAVWPSHTNTLNNAWKVVLRQ